jgi:hypothetical protein
MADARYHVTLGQKRTTVSMDTIVSEYLALHVGVQPDGGQAHSAVRAWLQRELDKDNDPGRTRVSQWLLGQALAAMVKPELAAEYTAFRERELDKFLAERRTSPED